MKLVMEAADLLRGMKAVRGAIERRNTIPVLGNVLLTAKGDKLSLRGTDLDLEIAVSVAAQVDQPGATTVIAETLLAFVQKLPKGVQVSMQLGERDVVIKAGRSRCTLVTLPAQGFPDLAIGDMTHKFEVGKDEFVRLFGKAQFAISTEETRYYLNGVYFHMHGKDKIRAVATDGHRLAQLEAAAPAGAEGMPGVIVPRKTVDQAIRLAEPCEVVKIELSQTKIIMGFGDVRMVSKLIDGTFPDYSRVVPTGNNKIALFDRVSVACAADRVATVSSDRGRAVKLSFAGGSLKLSVVNPNTGNADEDVEVDYDSDPIELGLNARYLADILSEVGGDKVRVALGDPGSPVLVRAEGDNSAIYVCMPMRV